MGLTAKQEYDINNMNVAAQNVNLGTLLNKISGSYSASFGNEYGYTAFEQDGTMIMTGSATIFDDLFVPLTTAKQGQTDQPAFDTTYVGYWFPQNNPTHVMYMIVQMPHSWKEGSTIYPHIHYQQTNSGSPIFKMDYKWHSIGGNTSGSFVTLNLAQKAISYSGSPMHQINASTSGIDGSGKTISSILQVKLYRDDNVYSGSILAYQFDIHYEKDTLGSNTQWTK